MAQQAVPVEELSFREAMEELNGVVATMEGNTQELEESLKSYERGVALIVELQKRLDEAQQQITSLMGKLEPQEDDAVRDTKLS